MYASVKFPALFRLMCISLFVLGINDLARGQDVSSPCCSLSPKVPKQTPLQEQTTQYLCPFLQATEQQAVREQPISQQQDKERTPVGATPALPAQQTRAGGFGANRSAWQNFPRP